MVDDTLILRKLSELDEYYKQIAEYKKITVAQYSGDWKVQRIIERTLQMMIETCVDVAGHIISDKGYRIPKSYSDTFMFCPVPFLFSAFPPGRMPYGFRLGEVGGRIFSRGIVLPYRTTTGPTSEFLIPSALNPMPDTTLFLNS